MGFVALLRLFCFQRLAGGGKGRGADRFSPAVFPRVFPALIFGTGAGNGGGPERYVMTDFIGF